MAGEKVTMILRSKTGLSVQEIEAMSDVEGWSVIYNLSPIKTEIHKRRTKFVLLDSLLPKSRSCRLLHSNHYSDVIIIKRAVMSC